MSVVHLHAHSYFSFGRGTSSPDALCAAAARQGVEALALTDLGTLAGVPEFLVAAERHGVFPILGAAFPDASVPRSAGSGRAVVLARDGEGYAELCRLVTRRHAAPHTPLNRVLEGCSDHLWVLTPDFSLLKAILRVRGPRFLLAELRAGTNWEWLAEEATARGVGVVGSAAVQLADASDRRFQRLLVAVHREVRFGRITRADLAPDRAWMLDEGAMRAAFSRWPDAMARAVDVARDCRIGDLREHTGAPIGGAEALGEVAARLRHRVVEAARERLGAPLPEVARARLERELATLCRGSRPAVVQLVADLAAHGRGRGIPTWADSPASGSLVAWCLDLIPTNPLEANLPFPMLCNDAADGALRLDLRAAAATRPRLVDRLRQELGDDRVARVGVVARRGLREALRDVSRSAALPAPECDRVLRLLPASWRGEGPDELLARHPRLQGAGLDEAPWDKVLRAAARLQGTPRGMTVGEGVVLAGGPVGDRVPLEPVDGRPVTQWGPDAAGGMGMLVLQLPDDGAARLQLRAGAAADPTLPPLQEQLPSLHEGLTIGCPRLEDRLVRRALRRHRPTDLPTLLRAVGGVPDEAFAEIRAGLAADAAGLDDRVADRLVRVLRNRDARVERAGLRRQLLEGLAAYGESRAAGVQRWDELTAELPTAPMRAELLSAVSSGLRALALRRASPAAFVAASLTEPTDGWPLMVHVSEAVRQGLTFRGPCVQTGAVDTAAVDGAVAVGLAQIRGVRAELGMEVVTSRRLDGAFADLAQFLLRVPAADDEVDALIAAGALDALAGEGTRTDLRLQHRYLRPHRDRPRSGRRRRAKEPPSPTLPAQTRAERDARRGARLRDELGALGFTLSDHPMHIVADELEGDLRDPAGLSTAEVGDQVDAAGWLVSGNPGEPGPPPPDLRWGAVFDAPLGLFDVAIPNRVIADRTEPLAGPCRMLGTLRLEGGYRWLEVQQIQRLAGLFGFARSA
ncbi:MAG: PHP domain-containing protein [Proteobacteria bacterium]|nr:PHP domain-containing protein [Pseudomonadota bacterium]